MTCSLKNDGFYAVCTTLEDDIETILRINKRRWEIEESFLIMKSEFHSRPVYLRREERIKAHFLTCFIALLIYRVLETKLREDISVRKLISTMKEMKYRRVEGLGYIPCYTRNHVTDTHHAACITFLYGVSVLGIVVKAALQLLRADAVDEGVGIQLADGLDDLARVGSVDDRVDDGHAVMTVASLAVHDGRPVFADGVDGLADLPGIPAYNEQGHLLVVAVNEVQHLRGYELKDDGVQRLVQAEECTGSHQQRHVEGQDDIERIHAGFLRQIDGDKVGAAAGGIHDQAHADAEAVDEPAEDADQKDVIRQGVGGQQIDEEAVGQNHDQGKQRKLPADEAKADEDRHRIDGNVDGGVGNMQMKKTQEDPLEQERKTSGTARVKTARADKGVDVDRHDEGGADDDRQPPGITFRFELHF